MSTEVEISVIVLNWNGLRYLQTCLPDLIAQTFRKFEIVLVDNGSRDGSVEWLEAHFNEHLTRQLQPYLKLVALPENTGFAGGNLAGLAACDPTSRYIATLNNDTLVDAQWLEQLKLNLDRQIGQEPDKRWGAACGPMLFSSTQHTIPTIAAAGIEVFRNGLALDGKVGQPLETFRQSPLEVFGPCAGAALYSRQALDEVGFFDPAFFAYLEDADLAWRLKLAGWHTLYVASAQVWHIYSGTGGQNSPFKNFQLGRNRLWTIFKNMPGPLLFRNLPAILLYDLAASFYTLMQGNQQPLRGRLAALHPRHWKRVWRQRQQIQRSRTTELVEIESWLKPNLPLWGNMRLRKKVDNLATTN